MSRVNQTRLQNWATSLINEPDLVQEVRDRFQLKMLDRFRIADAAKREEINHIMDNEQAFFEELLAICDEARQFNDEEEVN